MLTKDGLFKKRDFAEEFGRTTPSSTTSSSSSSSSASSTTTPSSPSQSYTPASGRDTSKDTNQDTAMGSKLIVGPNIRLKGVEIANCDTLIVEGHVEATIDSRMIQIAQSGTYTGNASIDVAEIRGEFSGELTVRKKLMIFASGKVSGKVRYGKLVIEEGGQLSGDVSMAKADEPSVVKPASSRAEAIGSH